MVTLLVEYEAALKGKLVELLPLCNQMSHYFYSPNSPPPLGNFLAPQGVIRLLVALY